MNLYKITYKQQRHSTIIRDFTIHKVNDTILLKKDEQAYLDKFGYTYTDMKTEIIMNHDSFTRNSSLLHIYTIIINKDNVKYKLLHKTIPQLNEEMRNLTINEII